MKTQLNIVTNEEANEMFEAEYKSGREYIDICGQVEHEGLLYTQYVDKRFNYHFAVQSIRNVHMGFNSNEPGKVEEFVAIVEREGACTATWGVTGRTMHQILACKLADSLPQYDWEIGYEYYLCKSMKK